MIIRTWRICRPLETGWRKDRWNASGTDFKRNLACFQSTLFILQSFCNHLSLLQNHFIDLLLNHHKITVWRTLTFYQFIAFYLSHVQFVTATIAFVNTLLNQALWPYSSIIKICIFFPQQINARAEVLRMERELEDARKKLTMVNQRRYQTDSEQSEQSG